MSDFVSRSERQHKEREQTDHKNSKRSSSAFDWIKAVVIALLLAIVVRGFFFEPTYVQGPSMLNTMKTGDKVLINKFIYRLKNPERSEIIVFHTTSDKDLIKRVIGLPGDTIQVKQNKVYINGKLSPEQYLASFVQTSTFPLTKVPSNHLFVMGDNRQDSFDSREFGTIPIDQVVGRAEVIYWPFSEWKLL